MNEATRYKTLWHVRYYYSISQIFVNYLSLPPTPKVKDGDSIFIVSEKYQTGKKPHLGAYLTYQNKSWLLLPEKTVIAHRSKAWGYFQTYGR